MTDKMKFAIIWFMKPMVTSIHSKIYLLLIPPVDQDIQR